MRNAKAIGLFLLAVVGIAVAVLVVRVVVGTAETDHRQEQLAAFYTPPDPLPQQPGTLIRSERLDVAVPGATAYRILYVSQRADGTPVASGGMLFVPTAPAPKGGRPVVAWAHGTLGQGDACAPSRSGNPLQDTANWLDQMMSFGWIVVSTDYAGLGTPGPNMYLVGADEARDVVNSVRAARGFAGADAGSRYAVWGHSQGGHSSLWTGHLAKSIAPELTLVGVAAAAPAAELVPITREQWSTVVGWVIGPEILVSWPIAYPGLPVDGVVSQEGRDNYERLAAQCVLPTAIEGYAREAFKQTFFAQDPTTNGPWLRATQDEAVPVMPASMPVFLAQGTADAVVLPGPNALLQETWCKAGSTLTALWMGGVNHNDAAIDAGPSATAWIADRFAGRPAVRTCDVPPPVAASAG